MNRLLIALVAAIAMPAAAQLTLQPASPRVHDMIEVLVNGAVIGQEWAASPGPDVAMVGNKIIVTLSLTGGSGVPANLDWAVGAFPGGSYVIEVVKRSPGGSVTSVGQAGFTVAPRTGNAPRTNYSDLYFNPAESGWGVNIQQHPSDKIFATWFVYGPDNKPIWYVIPDGAWTSDHDYTGKVYRTQGTYYRDTVWAAPSVIEVGSATLSFTRYNTVLMSYTIDGVSGQKAAVRQGF